MAEVHYKMLHVFVYVCAVDVQLTTNARNTLEFISKIEYYMRYADCRSKHAALRACSECLFDVITFRRSTFFRFFCANVKICTFDFRQLVCAPLRSLNSQTEAYFRTIVQQLSDHGKVSLFPRICHFQKLNQPQFHGNW